MKKKNIIIALTAIILIVIILVITFVLPKSVKTEKTPISETSKLMNLEISSPNIIYDSNTTTYLSTVKNNGNTINFKYIKVYLYDDKGNEYTFNGYIGDELKNNESRQLSYSTDEKIENIKYIKYELVK